MTMSELFREKSMNKVSSPEQLNDYIRVSNPSVWMVLAAIVVLLVGVCIWGVFGHLDTRLDTTGVCLNGTVTCYIPEADVSDIGTDALIAIGGEEHPVAAVAAFPVRFGDAELSHLLPSSELEPEAVVYAVTASAPELADGCYAVSVITRREAPMTFVLN